MGFDAIVLLRYRFMSHLRHKILNRREKKEGTVARNICNHCFREYSSPFLLQCHLENVHGTVVASSENSSFMYSIRYLLASTDLAI